MLTDHIEEVIFVGLPGPAHNYGGLSKDNVASAKHRGRESRPAEAARQALSLVRLLNGMGVKTAILPPQMRPHLGLLKTKFSGSPAELIAQAAASDPALLEAACSSSAMWVANAATVAPGIDAGDGKLHLTVANLHTNLHRRIEAEETCRTLSAIFKNVPECVVHAPVASRDEGAANHTRLCPNHQAKGLHIFAYGADGLGRQSLSASKEIARLHRLDPDAALFVEQNPEAIKSGVFHNDVIAVGNESFFLAHEMAYANGEDDFARIEEAYEDLHGEPPLIGIVHEKSLTLEEAVATYFFNSQIVTVKGGMAIIAPVEVKELHGGKAARLMEKICADPNNPVTQVHYADLRQSMQNGGGPACLRLRVPMTQAQYQAMRASVNVTGEEKLLEGIERVIAAHYPETLTPADLSDPGLYNRCRNVLTDLGDLMGLALR